MSDPEILQAIHAIASYRRLLRAIADSTSYPIAYCKQLFTTEIQYRSCALRHFPFLAHSHLFWQQSEQNTLSPLHRAVTYWQWKWLNTTKISRLAACSCSCSHQPLGNTRQQCLTQEVCTHARVFQREHDTGGLQMIIAYEHLLLKQWQQRLA